MKSKVDSRAIVRMATGAALYGVFSWLTNVLPLPSVSLVSVRPAIVIPIFFGLSWGPWVGFFVGGVGNLIGDTLSGIGFYPVWDLGNAVVGGLAGLVPLGRKGLADLGTWLCISGLMILGYNMRNLSQPLESNFLPAGWIPSEHYLWPIGLGIALAATWLASLIRARARTDVVWGLVSIAGGMGFASLLDMAYSGLSFQATMIGQFLPAVIVNSVNVAVLLPPLIRAYERALERAGR